VAAADVARTRRQVTSTVIALAWTRFQPRTAALATALGGEARFIGDGIEGSSVAARPLSYLKKAARTWRLLSRENPSTVLVITPPVFAPLCAWLWCTVHRRNLVVDCHTGAFHSSRWAWARPLHRVLLRRAKAVLLHTEELEALVREWGAPAMMVPDDLPDVSEAEPLPPPERHTVVIAGSFDTNEPVAQAVAAARLLPDVEFRYTGDPSLVAPDVRAGAAPNVVFTGYLKYPLFLGELLAADAVGVFSTDPRIMNRAAFEAIGLGKPLVLSDLPALKTRFVSAALFCANDPQAIADTIMRALRERDQLAAKSIALQGRLKSQRDGAVAQLQSIIHGEVTPVWRQRSAS
jgi:glycosyltransferase involved in cell wall biosynthesis